MMTAIVALSFAFSVLSSMFGGVMWFRTRHLMKVAEECERKIQGMAVVQFNSREKLRDLDSGLASIAGQTAEFDRALGELDERVANLEETRSISARSKRHSSGLNINRRSEIQRLLREGIAAETIAQEMEIALTEVRLIAHLDRSQAQTKQVKVKTA